MADAKKILKRESWRLVEMDIFSVNENVNIFLKNKALSGEGGGGAVRGISNDSNYV